MNRFVRVLTACVAFGVCADAQQSPNEVGVEKYAKTDASQNTACLDDRAVGVCWDLAACAIWDLGLPAPWDCSNSTNDKDARVVGGLSMKEGGDDYKQRPFCYVWGEEVMLPEGDSWATVWDSSPSVRNNSFTSAGVQEGDILQLDNYVASCGTEVFETTNGGPHTAVIIGVTYNTLEVCHQNWNGVTDGACGYTFFQWFTACPDSYSVSFDGFKIYRPGQSVTGGDVNCDTCQHYLNSPTDPWGGMQPFATARDAIAKGLKRRRL